MERFKSSKLRCRRHVLAASCDSCSSSVSRAASYREHCIHGLVSCGHVTACLTAMACVECGSAAGNSLGAAYLLAQRAVARLHVVQLAEEVVTLLVRNQLHWHTCSAKSAGVWQLRSCGVSGAHAATHPNHALKRAVGLVKVTQLSDKVCAAPGV